MAMTVAYIQEHGYDTKESLENSFSEIKKQASSPRKDLKSIEDKLRRINGQLHYTGQYLANKSVYQQFCKSKHKGQFRKEYSAEITLYETARKVLKEHSADGKLPSMKLLKAEKERLLQKKKEAQNKYHYYRDYQKELLTVCSKVNMILGQPHSRQPEKHGYILRMVCCCHNYSWKDSFYRKSFCHNPSASKSVKVNFFSIQIEMELSALFFIS